VRLDLPWGKGSVPLEVPARVACELVRPLEKDPPREAEAPGLLLKALESGRHGQHFSEFLSSAGGPVLCVVNDGTRPTPTRTVLEAVGDALAAADAHYLVATGSHRPPDQADLELIFGPELLPRLRERIHLHDSRDAGSLVPVGVTTRGTPVRLNRRVVESRSLLLVNSVEPHYFAGYTGGRKSLFPGVAGFEGIEANHRLALDPAATTLALAGNPVHEDALEAVHLLEQTPPRRTVFSIQVVLDRHQNPASVHAGDLGATFAAAVSDADAEFVVDVAQPADIVVAVAAYPMDYDLYQSQKALSAGVMALKPGGILILVSRCRHGIGEQAFYRLLATSKTPAAALEAIGQSFVLGYHKAARFAQIAEWGEMWAVTGLKDEEAEAAFMRPFPSAQAALDAALLQKGEGARLLVLTDGGVTVPRVRAH
jgi:lactate racemase